MAIIKRANCVLEVKDSEVDYYVNLGYKEIDENGKIIRDTIPNDLGTLKNLYVTHLAEIEKLHKQIEDLQAQLKAKVEEPKAEAPKRKYTKKTTE